MEDAYLAFVTHDTQNNTLEATWLQLVNDMEGNPLEYRRVKSRNYLPEQKVDFETDCGPAAAKYVTMAGW